MRPSRRTIVGATTLLVVVLVWYVATTGLGLVSAGRFPAPSDVESAAAQAFGRGYPDATLFVHVMHSLKLVALGFLVSVVLGVLLGLLMGWNRTAEALINPVFLLLRPIPPLAWIPLAILWLGLGDAAKVLVIFLAAFPPSVISTHAGVRAIGPAIIEAAQMLGTPRTRFVTEVLAPAAAPMIFTGLRLSLQASWTTLVAAELVGSLAGLGYVLNVAQQDLYPGMILVGMGAVGILGAASTALLGFAERRLVGWAQTKGAFA
ncbi:ABC transporter permease [Methylobacterium trifolii]|uniref:Aliphatic sulfonates transport permease protein SsuC n=1 Tax=Methylobacterium trifolii TaxID=1003092 RepID=A0ABQ4U1F9_9HYPH|nr:ABC transporter permease [Methylobacterium trifolii]GJE61121.1 Putative aliphatic sulfonates transport permease protein SsuC [Methylobacterium trifolii]